MKYAIAFFVCVIVFRIGYEVVCTAYILRRKDKPRDINFSGDY